MRRQLQARDWTRSECISVHRLVASLTTSVLQFLDETFYFPHNLDFRGRAYPIPPNLSHIGNDMCRGILTFAEAKPLGERGLRWLKIHLANMTGFDKASFDEREAYTMERLEEIYDSADRPLEVSLHTPHDVDDLD